MQHSDPQASSALPVVLRPVRIVLAAGLLLGGVAALQAAADATSQDDAAQTSSEDELTELTTLEEPATRRSDRDPTEPVVPPEAEEPPNHWTWGSEDAETDAADAAGMEETTEADETTAADVPPVEIVRARRAGELGHRWVQDIRQVDAGGARPEWSRQGDRIAFDGPGDDAFRALYLMDSDGSARRCLTCEMWPLKRLNALSPTWHPSGDWLVFVVQDLPKRLLSGPLGNTSVRRSYHADLAVIRTDGKGFWTITQSSQQGRAVLDPHFSYEGDRIAWSERVDSTIEPDGGWVVRVARLEMKRGVPSLEDVETYRPTSWPARVVVEGFTQDDQGLWLTVTPKDRDQDTTYRGTPFDSGAVAARYDLTSRRLTLVETGDARAEGADTVPRGERIVYASDRNIRVRDGGRLPYRSDLWFTTGLGLRTERLTFFNDPLSDHHQGEALVADATWAPDGTAVLLHLVTTDGGLPADSLWRVDVSTALQD